MHVANVVIASMGLEGGGGTLFGCETDGVWSFWNEGNSMFFDENDDEDWRDWKTEPVAELSLALSDIWWLMFPLEVHPDFKAQLRVLYEAHREDERARWNRDRWLAMLA